MGKIISRHVKKISKIDWKHLYNLLTGFGDFFLQIFRKSLENCLKLWNQSHLQYILINKIMQYLAAQKYEISF